MNKTDGWISLHRKIIDNPIFIKPSEWLKVWIYLLLEVDHQTGEGFFQWEIIQNGCHITHQQLRECLNFLETENMIIRKKLPRGVEITVQNWLDYQNKRKTPSKTPSNRPSEIDNEVSIEAEQKSIENFKDPINLDKEDPIHNTISSNNISKDISDSSLNENSLKEKTNEGADSQPVAKVKGTEMQELIKSFCQEMGFQYGSASIKINVKSAKWLLENYEMSQILDAVKWQKSKIIKEKKNPAIFIPNLVTVQKWIDNWIGNLGQEKEKETKDKKGGYII